MPNLLVIEAAKTPTVDDMVIRLVDRVAERGLDGAAQSFIETHLVIDRVRADAARTLAEAFSAEFSSVDQAGERITKVLSTFLDAEVNYDVPSSEVPSQVNQPVSTN